MAPWSRRRSSRRWRGAAAASSRSSATRPTQSRMQAAVDSASRRRQAAPMRSSFRTARTTCRRSCNALQLGRRQPAPRRNCSAPACGTIRASSPTRRCMAAGIAAPDTSRLQRFRAALSRDATGSDPVRTATLSYDAAALVAALVQTKGRNAVQRADADKSVGLCRHRRRVPLPRGRHERARAGGDAGDAVRAARS